MLFLFQDGEGVPVVSLSEEYTPEMFAEKRGLRQNQYLVVDEIRGLPEKWELFPLGLTLDLARKSYAFSMVGARKGIRANYDRAARLYRRQEGTSEGCPVLDEQRVESAQSPLELINCWPEGLPINPYDGKPNPLETGMR